METPIRFKVQNMAVIVDGVYVQLIGVVDEEPKTDGAFVQNPAASMITMYLRPDVAKKFSVGTVHTVSFK